MDEEEGMEGEEEGETDSTAKTYQRRDPHAFCRFSPVT